MTPKICICCGELMADQANLFSRNPNVCASCSSMLDGMDETTRSQLPELPSGLAPCPQDVSPARRPDHSEEVMVKWSSGRIVEHE